MYPKQPAKSLDTINKNYTKIQLKFVFVRHLGLVLTRSTCPSSVFESTKFFELPNVLRPSNQTFLFYPGIRIGNISLTTACYYHVLYGSYRKVTKTFWKLPCSQPDDFELLQPRSPVHVRREKGRTLYNGMRLSIPCLRDFSIPAVMAIVPSPFIIYINKKLRCTLIHLNWKLLRITCASSYRAKLFVFFTNR